MSVWCRDLQFEDWSSQLGLSFSPVGRVVHSLAASVEQARNCVDMGPKLYHALAVCLDSGSVLSTFSVSVVNRAFKIHHEF